MISAQETHHNKVYLDFIKSFRMERGFGAHDWLGEIRERAYERLQALGFPTRKSEAWKYINLDPILNASFIPTDGTSLPDFTDETLIQDHFLSEYGSNRLVFINGIYSNKFSSVQKLPAGSVFENLSTSFEKNRELVKLYLAKNVMNEPNPFALANTFSFKDGAFLYLYPAAEIKDPIHLLFIESETELSPSVSHPRILIVADKNAKANIVIDHIGFQNSRNFMNAVSEIYLGKNSEVRVEILQRNAHQFLATRVYLEEESKFEVIALNQNGIVTRNETNVNFVGKSAFCKIQGLSVLSGDSQAYEHITVNHAFPECTSRQLYKNILAGRAKSEFNSLVHVHRDAQKSDSNQLNRNLLLSETARAYSRPQLRIDADDVKATHGAATGQIEKDELFYLQSRGIQKDTARLMLTYGFVEEVLEQIQPKHLRTQLEQSVRLELEEIVKKADL